MTTGLIAATVEITDSPRFGYRSLMLDPARRFVPLAAIKRVIDQMAL
ncbi:beta-N-acetylhexosaminidase [Renibacterium salmoninarum ATCC 33209]|uniref:beta-N-acetylhexosaminidase n=1 Tax=Renibacterium salmoninarum (strain ATCC 33209 / DSM 20767 / JCM 11484 / NBRC 15589 / NCIMB 2235) TaxID=288705 RepID=A9WV93_RENSM|nr:beta-N-acetylhexosaminidase [Renibacterium salmoninarum ATCC 33209]